VPQTAKLENSVTFATGQTVQAFRVPTFDSTNKSKFYDVVIDLNINADGSTTSATVTSTPSLIIGTVEDSEKPRGKGESVTRQGTPQSPELAPRRL